MEEITSRSNARVKAAAQLLSSAAARREEGLFVLEGARLCMDAGQTGIPLRQLFFNPPGIGTLPEGDGLFEGKSRFRFFDYRGN